MPAVGDLDRVWQRLGGGQGVSAATVAGDQCNLRLRRQPGLCRRGLTIGKERDCPAPLQIADQRAVTSVASPRPVVDPDCGGRDKAWAAPTSNRPQQRVLADRQHQAPGQARGGASAQRQAEIMDDVIQPRCAARPWRQEVGVKPLDEDPTTAKHGVAVKSARHDQQTDPASGNR